MVGKNKKIILLQRLFIWALYIFSGFLIYSRKGNLYTSLTTFTRVVYPLSIFWLQIRIKRKSKFLPIDSSMTTAQLWFNLLPVLASLVTVFLSILNAILFILEQLINS